MGKLTSSITNSYPLFWPRCYAFIRTRILPIDKIERFVPEGRVLDAGCGFGITSIYFALKNLKREVIGSEISEERIRIAKMISSEIPNVCFRVESLIKSGEEKFDAIVAVDLLHHINNKEKEDFVRESRNRLNKNGILIIKDIDKKPLFKYYWNYLHDKIMTRERLYFYSAKQMKEMLEKNGFKIKEIRRIKSLFYPHVLFVCSGL
jgi:2-polyprenyl-3-methyl-5-hydroxy-6-metoxy-1,4-benzoquinol methylase